MPGRHDNKGGGYKEWRKSRLAMTETCAGGMPLGRLGVTKEFADSCLQAAY
jgi:hypothetical protein